MELKFPPLGSHCDDILFFGPSQSFQNLPETHGLQSVVSIRFLCSLISPHWIIMATTKLSFLLQAHTEIMMSSKL